MPLAVRGVPALFALLSISGHGSCGNREDVVSLRTQTHNHAGMQVYRRRLRALGGRPPAQG